MVNQNIIKFLDVGQKQGFTLEELKNALQKKGFDKKEIEEAIQSNQTENKTALTSPQSAHQANLNFFTKIKKSLLKPSQLFEQTNTEGILPALKYQLLLSLIPFVIYSLIAILFLQFLFTMLGSFIPFIASPDEITNLGFKAALPFITWFGVTFFIMIPILTFIFAGVLHLTARMFGAQGNYAATYKTAAYATTPSLILSFIPFVNVAAGIWNIIISATGISIYHKTSKPKAFTAIILSIILFAMIVGIITFALAFLGLGIPTSA